MKQMVYLILSYVNHKPALNGVNIALYLSIASTVRVIEDTCKVISIRTTNLETNLANSKK